MATAMTNRTANFWSAMVAASAFPAGLAKGKILFPFREKKWLLRRDAPPHPGLGYHRKKTLPPPPRVGRAFESENEVVFDRQQMC